MGICSFVVHRVKSIIPSAEPVFIHIPKTGGTYVAQRESDRNPVIWPIRYLGHVCVTEKKRQRFMHYPPVGFTNPSLICRKELSKCVVLSSVRNIFSWLVSYAGHSGGYSTKYHDENHYDYENSRKGFDYLIKTIANRESPWPSRKFIHFQIFSDFGCLIVDYLARNETLDDDLKAFSAELGLNYKRKQRQRVGGMDDYRSYYTDSLIELVSQTWGRELKLFGYDFGDMHSCSAFIKKRIDSITKLRVKYFWSDDKLLVDGKVVN